MDFKARMSDTVVTIIFFSPLLFVWRRGEVFCVNFSDLSDGPKRIVHKLFLDLSLRSLRRSCFIVLKYRDFECPWESLITLSKEKI